MKTRDFRSMKMGWKRVAALVAIGALAIALLTHNSPGQETAPSSRARQILADTGVRGGLVVHLGCGDGRLTAALRASDRFLVQGLDEDERSVEQARRTIRSAGLEGVVSADRWNGRQLPYVDNLVDLIVADRQLDVSEAELLRVLAPGGVARVRKDGAWTKIVKPRPKEIDEWTHYLHDASGNAVAHDGRVGPPRRLQWLADPHWARNHHYLASISSVVSAGGRVFYIVDEGPPASIAAPGQWSIVARDAFNGVLLWKRTLAPWASTQHGFRSGPVQLPRMLVAEGDRVYAPSGVSSPVVALDAATGQVVETYDATDGAEEWIVDEGVLLAVTGSPVSEQAESDKQLFPTASFPNHKSIVAIRALDGDLLWKWTEPSPGLYMPLTLAADGRSVFFQAGQSVVRLDRETGDEVWRSPVVDSDRAGTAAAKSAKRNKGKSKRLRTRSSGWSVATLVVQDGVVLWTQGRELRALSATDGRALWQSPCSPGFRSPTDVFVIRGVVWTGPDFRQGLDLHTGQVRKTVDVLPLVQTAGHHHRCYRQKATDRYLLNDYRGVEFIDLEGQDHSRNNWVRGVCQYGVMPCNGLLYAPSHACGCYMEAQLHGFWALAPESKTPRRPARSEASALERGPAYDDAAAGSAAPAADQFGDWPTYRHDPLRSGVASSEIPWPLEESWRAEIGGRLSAPVVSEGLVVVSAIDAHRVEALDAAAGRRRWSFTAGGRVDSPPTIYRGLVLFGCADGWVYALRARDGQLAWRFRAAPDDLRTVARDQIESVWPVPGAVLVSDGVAYAAAGRSSYLDGGIALYGLDPATGKVVSRSRVASKHAYAGDTELDERLFQKIGQNAVDAKTFRAPDKSDAFSMSGATNDVLVSDGRSIFLRQLRFDRDCRRQEMKSRHLFSTSSLLDDAESHRSHWVLGTGDFSRIAVAYSWIANSPNGRYGMRLSVPYGLMLAFDDQTVWGIRRLDRYTLFAQRNKPFSQGEETLPDFRPADNKTPPKWLWSLGLDLRPRAIVKSGGRLLLAGAPSLPPPESGGKGRPELASKTTIGAELDASKRSEVFAAFEGRGGGVLSVVSARDGRKLAERPLPAPPVWNGVAAAGGRLYMALANGKLVCWAKP